MSRGVYKWATLLLTLLSTSVFAEGKTMPLNLTKGVTDISAQVYDLHMIIFIICAVIGVVVFGAMFVSMLLHRKSKGVTPANFHESTKVEIVWTVIPFLILIGIAIPAANTLIAMEARPKPTETKGPDIATRNSATALDVRRIGYLGYLDY